MRSGTKSNGSWLLVFSIVLMHCAQAFAQAGQLDPTFGKKGIATTDFGEQSYSNIATPTAVTIQPDGKILVCGGVPTSSGFPTAAVARYNTDGSLDKAFGTRGVVATPNVAVFTAIALQSDGKIIATGLSGFVYVVRYTANGTLDTTFGTTGIVKAVESFANATTSGVLVQPDGKIVVADVFLIRLLADGNLDSGFGTAGVAKLAGYRPTAVSLLANGKILVASAFTNSGFEDSGFVSRYNSNGSLDTGFGINGQLATAGPTNAFVLLNTGEFVVGGSLISNLTVENQGFGPSTGFAVSRYLGGGSTDAKFGTHGGTLTGFSSFPNVITSGLGVQSSGDIVILGTATNIQALGFALARYTPTGQLDTTFGNKGTVHTSFGSSLVTAYGLAIQSDGKIVAVGSYITPHDHGVFSTGFKLARYLGQ